MAGLDVGPVKKDRLFSALEKEATSGSARGGGAATLAPAGPGDYLDSDEDDEDLDEFPNYDEDYGPDDEALLGFDKPEGEAGLGFVYDPEFDNQPRGPSGFIKDNGPVLSSYRSTQETRHSMTQHHKAKNLEQLQSDYAAKIAAADERRSALDSEEQRLRALRRKAADPGATADPVRLGFQEREVEQAWERLTDAEYERDRAELALHRASEDGARAGRLCLQESAEAAAMAHTRHLDEVDRAKKTIAKGRDARAAAAEQERQVAEERARKDEEAQFHRQKSIQRLKAAQAIQKERATTVEEIRENQIAHDAQRVLNLKNSVEKINKKLRSANEQRQKKNQKVKEEREKEKRDLLDSGQNPYEVWRRQEMDADKERQKKALQEKGDLRSEKLLKQLMEEDIRYKKQQREAKIKRRHEEDFQREMGNYAKEAKIAAYIKKMTIGNVEVLDPTGTALRIDPSKVTVQRTHAFGLGRSCPEEIRKVQSDVKKAKVRAENMASELPDDPDSMPGSPLAASAPLSRAHPAAARDRSPDVGSSGDADDAPQGIKAWAPKLSVLEQEYLAAARERQKQNICSVQKCWGKEFKGDAFLAKPSVIAFNDFEVGKRYRQIVEVTNVSLTFNQFKLLPLDDKVKEFFEIEFVPPGRMSAGVTRYITIWFIPKMNENIETTFPILAKTGRIDFPLRCKTKETVLTMTPQDPSGNPIIDFGQVLLGEQSSRTLQVKNSGALSAAFNLDPAEECDFLSMVEYTPHEASFRAHGMTTVRFVFKPDAVGDYSSMLRLSITNNATGDALFEKEMLVFVRGSCLSVPIHVEKEEYDMQTCVYGHIFRENIIIHNRQSVAMRVTVEKPKLIDGELQLTPTLAYVQGYKEQIIQVKFSPKRDFLDKNKKFRDSTRHGEEGAFRIPVVLKGADQELPVCTDLVGTLTSNEVNFYPSKLGFGACFVGCAAVCRMGIVNESLLPQQYAFLRLPHFLSVSDVPVDVLREEEDDDRGDIAVLDGHNTKGSELPFGTLLPKERREVYVTYTPDSVMQMDHAISMKVITGGLCVREFSIPCVGQGCSPILKFSSPQIDLASIPCDTSCKESVVITNASKVAYTMNILVPPVHLGALYVSPVCCVLQPNDSKRVQVEFRPTLSYTSALRLPPPEPVEVADEGDAVSPPPGDPLDPEEEAARLEQKRLEEEAERRTLEAAHRKQALLEIREHGGRRWEVEPAEGEFEEEEEGVTAAKGETKGEPKIHSYWKLPVCLQVAEGTPPKSDAKKPKAIHLGVRTCVLPRLLHVEPLKLDFEQVTAKERKVLPLTLRSLVPDDEQVLSLEALPESACFTVLNALRTVGAKPFQIQVEFNPQLVQIYESKLVLHTQRTRVEVPLCGRGVRPVLSIEPEDGVITMGSIVYTPECRDYHTGRLEIKNDSPYKLCYQLDTVIPAEGSSTGVPTFTLTPQSGAVEAHGSRSVTVTFRPHRPMAVFMEKVLVNVPNQRSPTYVYLYGHSFSYQAYSIPGMIFGPFDQAMAAAMGAGGIFTDALALGAGSGARADGDFSFKRAQPTDISLVFDHQKEERTKFLIVGAGHAPGTPAAPQTTPPVTYDFIIQPSEFSSLFSVDFGGGAGGKDAKAGKSLAPSTQAKVIFTYSPPEDSNLVFCDVSLDLLGGIGQWITCQVKGTLSGGYVPPGSPATQEINVELRAYLQQI